MSLSSHLKSGADPLEFDGLTLSNCCQDKIYQDSFKKAEILKFVEKEPSEAEKNPAAVEEQFEEVTPEVLEHIIVARVKLKMNVIHKKPQGVMGNSEEFDERDVEKLFQRQSDARTTIYARWENAGFPRELLWVIPMATSAGLRNKQAGLPARENPVDSPDSPDTPMAMTGYKGTDIEGSSTREG